MISMFGKENKGQVWGYMPLISAPERERQVDLYELKASLVYTVSFEVSLVYSKF